MYTNVQASDAAVLQCNASNGHGYIFTNAYLNVLAEPPAFIHHPQPVIKVAENTAAELACAVFGAPKPEVIWFKDDVIVEGPRFSIDTKGKIVGNLTIDPVSKEDAGIFRCKAENRFGKVNGTGELIVRSATQITETPVDTEVIAGTDVVLHCGATTDENELDNLKISWRKGDNVIIFEDEPNLSFNTNDNSLTITGAAVSDTAGYTCVASNGLDSDEYTAQVTVKDRPRAPFDMYLKSCKAQSAEVEWMLHTGSDNNDPITHYIIYYNTTFDPEGVYHVAHVPDSNQLDTASRKAKVALSPWANFTFHIVAVNSIGASDIREFSAVCVTPAQEPFRDPNNVCTSSGRPDQLIITWEHMPQLEHHGDQFHYLVTYRPLDAGEEERETLVYDWQQETLVIDDQPTYQSYQITVRAVNELGSSPDNQMQSKIGYSGEDAPTVAPSGFQLVTDTLTATSANFTWTPVEDTPENIQGFFRGYKIVFWRASDPDTKRETELILNEFNRCPNYSDDTSSRWKRQSDSNDLVTGHVPDLWPFSQLKAGVLILNGAKSGALGDIIDFSTPEGLPGKVGATRVVQKGSTHLKLEWLPPLEKNGIILGYSVWYKKVEDLTGKLQRHGTEPYTPFTSYKLKKLDPETAYVIHVYAHTSKGQGLEYGFATGSTIALMAPDKPGVYPPEYSDKSALVSWRDTKKGDDVVNPGSEFYVKYRLKDNDTWIIAKPEDDIDNFINITGLTEGENYELVVVAVSGHGDAAKETESDVVVFTAGPKKVPVKTGSLAKAGWFISLLILLIILLLILLLIICCVRFNRGGKYPVHEKEKLSGRPDDPEDRLGEYNKQPYMPLQAKSDEPNTLNQKPPPVGGLPEEEPLAGGSESDSMAEYEDTDPTKFNEDGSFIGAYGEQGYSKKADDTSPLSTFV